MSPRAFHKLAQPHYNSPPQAKSMRSFFYKNNNFIHNLTPLEKNGFIIINQVFNKFQRDIFFNLYIF